MAEQLDTGFGRGFSTMKGVPDLFVDGKPALSSTSNSPPPATEDSQPAPASSDPPAIDLDRPVAEAEQRLQQLWELPPPALPTAPASPGAQPDRYSFNDPTAFERGLIEWAGKDSRYRAEQRVYDTAKQRFDEWQSSVGQAQLAAYNARRQRAIARHPDYVEVAERPDLAITPPMAVAIAKLPEGAELAHWLGQPAQQAQVEKLSKIADPAEVMLLMGRLATRFAAKPAATQPKERPRQKAVDDMNMSEYAAHRLPQLRSRLGMFGGGR